MVQLEILSGKKAGTVYVPRRFPVRVGRSAVADLRLEEEGVWDQHLRLEFKAAEGVILCAQPEALATVNGRTVAQTLLHNGDAIEIGSSKMKFWLGATRQSGLGFREWLVWALIAAISLGQIALIYCLLG